MPTKSGLTIDRTDVRGKYFRLGTYKSVILSPSGPLKPEARPRHALDPSSGSGPLRCAGPCWTRPGQRGPGAPERAAFTGGRGLGVGYFKAFGPTSGRCRPSPPINQVPAWLAPTPLRLGKWGATKPIPTGPLPVSEPDGHRRAFFARRMPVCAIHGRRRDRITPPRDFLVLGGGSWEPLPRPQAPGATPKRAIITNRHKGKRSRAS